MDLSVLIILMDLQQHPKAGGKRDRKYRQQEVRRKAEMPRRVLRPEVLRSITRQSSVLFLGKS